MSWRAGTWSFWQTRWGGTSRREGPARGGDLPEGGRDLPERPYTFFPIVVDSDTRVPHSVCPTQVLGPARVLRSGIESATIIAYLIRRATLIAYSTRIFLAV